MSALGRALKHVSGSHASVPQHRARWEARQRERQTRQNQRSHGEVVVFKVPEVPGTARSRASTAWSGQSSSKSTAASARTNGTSIDGDRTEMRPAVGPVPPAHGEHLTGVDALVRHEASVSLEAARALQGTQRSRLRSDSAQRKRSQLRSDIREAIAREGVYRDPYIDAGTVVRVGRAGGAADNRPVVDRHGRFFGMGATGRARQVAHAQEVMAGGPLTPESNRRVLPLAVPVTPKMQGAPHSGGSPMLLHTHLNPSTDGRKQGGFARRASAELRALDSIYETKLRGGNPRQYHHLGGARNTDTTVGAGYVVEGPPRGYVTGPLTEVQWGPTAVDRLGVAPSAAVASNKGGLGVREYTAIQPAVRRIGGATDPNWERRRPTLHKLHPDAEELLKLQNGWSEGWGTTARWGADMSCSDASKANEMSRAVGLGSHGNQWSPPLVDDLHEAHGRLVGNWESEESAATAVVSGRDKSIGVREPAAAVFSHQSQPILYDGEYRRSLSLREALES